MAQLDNAADSDSEERGFESLWAGQKILFAQRTEFFYPSRRLGISSAVRRYIIKGGTPPLYMITP